MRILVAEDERDLAEAIRAMLERERHSVDVAYDGRTASEWTSAERYDCVVLDIMMPRMSGLDALQRMRNRGDSTPVLLLTAKSDPHDRVIGLDLGADDYLPKPFDMEEFLARIRALTRRSGSYAPSTLSAGDLSLDRSSFELSCGERAVRLGRKEFQIAELLMRHADLCVSTELLVSTVWGRDNALDPSVVWTTISYLRRKIEGIGSQATIRARRGQGYTLETS